MDDIAENKLEKKMDLFEKKMSKFSEILQKFGLDLIQSIGGLKHELSILSSKIENVDKSIIEIKGIKIQLQETNKIQREWQKDISDIKSSIRTLNQKYGMPATIANHSQMHYSKINETPRDVLDNLLERVTKAKEVLSIYDAIKKTKEQIFILTGGHKLLIELRAYEQKAKRDSNIDFKSFQETIKKKIPEWKDQM